MGQYLFDTIDTKEIKFKSIEGDFFIFDIEIYPPEWRKIKEIINGEEKIVRRKIPRIIENAKVKLGENKAEIIKKVNTFNKHDIMYLRYCIPKGGDNWAPETWKLLNVWNEEDRWEYNYKYQNTLFDDEFIPRYKNEVNLFNKKYIDKHFGYNFWKWDLNKFKRQKDIFTKEEKQEIYNLMKNEFSLK